MTSGSQPLLTSCQTDHPASTDLARGVLARHEGRDYHLAYTQHKRTLEHLLSGSGWIEGTEMRTHHTI